MSVATAPTAALLHLGDEIRQSQSALLYADSITLVSLRAPLIHSTAAIEDAPDLEMFELLMSVAVVRTDDFGRLISAGSRGNMLPCRRKLTPVFV